MVIKDTVRFADFMHVRMGEIWYMFALPFKHDLTEESEEGEWFYKTYLTPITQEFLIPLNSKEVQAFWNKYYYSVILGHTAW